MRKIPSLSQAKGFFVFGGADGARTRDLLTASQTFSQLNYGPTKSVTLLFLETDDALDIKPAFLFLYLPFSSYCLRPGVVFFCVCQSPGPSLSCRSPGSAIVLIKSGLYVLACTYIVATVFLTLQDIYEVFLQYRLLRTGKIELFLTL